jgi:hypothetical protein
MTVYLAPDNAVSPQDGLLALAAAYKTLLANCKLRLFKSTIAQVAQDTSLSQLQEAEADFPGYTAGGVTVAAMNDPITEIDGSVSVYSPLVQFNYDSAEGEGANTIGGFYVVSAAGALILAARFEETITLDDDASGLPLVFGRSFTNN